MLRVVAASMQIGVVTFHSRHETSAKMLFLEVAGWAIIIFELLAGNQSNEIADRFHGWLEITSTYILRQGWRSPLLLGIFITAPFYISSDFSEIVRDMSINIPFIVRLIDSVELSKSGTGGDIKAIIVLFGILTTILSAFIFSILKLIRLHPKGAVSGLGVFLAFSGSILSRF